MKGLYFYKLVSPYSEDVSKECKLTVNEIDHNFVTLKDADIKDFTFDENSNIVSLVRNNNEKLMVDLSPMIDGITRNLSVDYDNVKGVITIDFNGERVTIDGLITDENIYSEAITEVITDGSLNGLGSKKIPLGVASVEKTGVYRPAIKLIDRTIGEFLPKPCNLRKGDRYVTYENVSDYGYLYNYNAVTKINEDLKHGWRVPTKEDWDNMLNAIEPCDDFRNHNSALANNMLGKIAGKLLKAKHFWKNSEDCIVISCECNVDEEIFDVDDFTPKTKPNEKKISPKGSDSFGMRIMPSGFHDGCEITDYFEKRGIYWTNSVINETDVYVKRFDYNKSGVIQNVESPRNYFSLRLVKDYEGWNHQQVEFINGMDYNTILLPSLNTKNGFTIWTLENVAFSNEKYNPIEPNNGEGISYCKRYFINEWNGFDWEKKQMHEGESIVLFKGLEGEHNMEYRIMNGVLYSEAKTIYDKIMEWVQPEIDRIDEEIINLKDIVGDGLVDEEGNRITITDKVDELDKNVGEGFFDEEGNRVTITDKLKQEIEDRVAADEQLRNDLDKEIAERIEADKKLQEAIEEEARQREEADTLLQEEIDTIEVSVGLDEDGLYIKREDSNYINDAETVVGAIDELDVALKIEEESRIKQDDVIEDSVGLGEDGSYIKRDDSNYINDAETVVGAIDELDVALKQEELDRIKQDNVIEGSVGLGEDGSYIKTNGHYTSDAETIAGAIEALDNALKQEELDRIEQDEYLFGRLIKEGEQPNEAPNVAYDCANGVLTLFTENPKHNITIKLNGDYGIFPYKENKD